MESSDDTDESNIASVWNNTDDEESVGGDFLPPEDAISLSNVSWQEDDRIGQGSASWLPDDSASLEVISRELEDPTRPEPQYRKGRIENSENISNTSDEKQVSGRDGETYDKMKTKSTEYSDITDRIDNLMEQCSIVIQATRTDANKSRHSLQTAFDEITKYRKEVNERITELQNTLEIELQTLQHRNDSRIETEEKICDDVRKKATVMKKNLKKLNMPEQSRTITVHVDLCQVKDKLQEYENSINTLKSTNSVEEYEFVRNSAISDVLWHEKRIGEIVTKLKAQPVTLLEMNHSTPAVSPYKNLSPTGQHEICVKSSDDRKKCWITSMAVLPPERLVVVDYNNNSIKLVALQQLIDNISLGTEYVDTPCDITATSDSQVAVTVPDRQHIQFISVSDKLSMAHTIPTEGNCSHICCYQQKLIVTYSNPSKLEILDLNGTVLNRVKTDATGKDLFRQPTYVQANNSFIYVCDVEHGKLIKLNWQGEITGMYGELGDLAGLALLNDGTLLLCDYSSNRVNQVSEDCSNSRQVLHNVRCPLAICVNSEFNKLYVSRYTKDYGYIDNNIVGYNI